MDGRAFTLHAYANIKHGFAQTEKFSQCTPHIDLIIVVPQWSCTTAMLKNITENNVSSSSVFSLVSRLTLFQYLLVPEPISASFCLRGYRQPEINGRVAGNLITRHYEAVMLLWLLCNVTFACIWNNGGAEGHHIRSFSAQCNQSHTSSWYKNKQLDFQSIMWDCYFFVCAGVLMCA